MLDDSFAHAKLIRQADIVAKAMSPAERSAAAKKGWATRRARGSVRSLESHMKAVGSGQRISSRPSNGRGERAQQIASAARRARNARAARMERTEKKPVVSEGQQRLLDARARLPKKPVGELTDKELADHRAFGDADQRKAAQVEYEKRREVKMAELRGGKKRKEPEWIQDSIDRINAKRTGAGGRPLSPEAVREFKSKRGW